VTVAAGAHAAARDAVDRALVTIPGDMSVFTDEAVDAAEKVVDASGTVALLEGWMAERRADGNPNGAGRKRTIPPRALLVAMLLAALDGRDMLLSRFARILFHQIGDDARSRLGVTGPAPGTTDRRKAEYRNVRTLFHDILAVMDPSPLPKNRILTKEEVASHENDLSPAQVALMYERLDLVANALLEAALCSMPRDVYRRWRGTLGIDATPVPLFARGTSKKSKWASVDPDGGWYVREGDHRDPDTLPDGGAGGRKRNAKKIHWALEATIATTGSDDPDGHNLFPNVPIGVAMHRPGFDPAGNAMRVLGSVRSRRRYWADLDEGDPGHPAGWLAADAAYFPNSKPEDLQLPVRGLGYEPVFDYREDQMGRRGSQHGAIMVEGAFLCPATPTRLIEATQRYRRNEIDAADYFDALDERDLYRMRKKGGPGQRRLMCPASGKHDGTVRPVASCAHKRDSTTLAPAGLPKVQNPPAEPVAVCTQQTVTFRPGPMAKYEQTLPYGTDEWHARYTVLRQTIESTNGVAKDPAKEALAAQGRRRVRGIAAQTLLVAFLLLAVSLRKIRKFLDDAEDDARKTGRPDGSPVFVRRKPTVKRKPRRPDGTNPLGRRVRTVVRSAVPPDPTG